MKFGLLSYSDTNNLGDEIQSLAARRFLPQVDHFIDRESLDTFKPGSDASPVALVLNGWFCHRPENWPPAASIRPLLVSMHISTQRPAGALSPPDTMLSEPAVRYLRRLGPVGARDVHTLDLLRAADVEAYFSGCLTLTLERPDVEVEADLLVLGDVPSAIARAVSRMTKKRIVSVTHANRVDRDIARRFDAAEALLRTYARASCVVTTNLHTALPCVAMGTPVLLLDSAPDQYRFSGLHDLVRHARPKEFLDGRYAFDLDNPSPNGETHRPLRESLIARVRGFVDAVARGSEPMHDGLSLEERLEVLLHTKHLQSGLVDTHRRALDGIVPRASRAAYGLIRRASGQLGGRR
jgi:hypothetical protein